MIRRESSAETAARFFELKRQRHVRKRAASNRRSRREMHIAAVAPRVSVVRAVLPVDIVRSAAWIPGTPVALALAAQPIGRIEWPVMPYESNADRLRRYRLAAVANGRCYTCRCRPVRPGARYCDRCIKAADDYRNSIAYKKCQNCGVDVRGRSALLCVECTTKQSEYGRRQAVDRMSRGLCSRCGKRPLRPGATQCVVCLDEERDAMLARSRLAGSKPKSCPICRELGIGGTGHDRRTHDRWMERRKAWAPEAV